MPNGTMTSDEREQLKDNMLKFVNRQLDFVRLRQAQGRVFLTARHGRHIVSPKGQRGPGQRKAAGQA